MSETIPEANRHPIRVVRIIDRLNVGGPTYHVLLLTRDLPARGYDPILVKGQIAPGEAEMTAAIDQIGADFLDLPGFTKAISLRDIGVFWALYRLLRRVRPHIVHTHKTKAGALGRLAALLAGVPVIVHTFHGHAFDGYFSRLANYIVLVIERLLAHRTDAVVTVSTQVRRALLSYGIASPKRVHTIPLGLELEPFLAAERSDDGFREELGFAPNAPLVCILGRVVPIKGLTVFLRAAKRVLAEIPDARFVVVGDGESRVELEEFAHTLELGDRVNFTGFRDDVIRIFASVDLVAQSSFNEGSPVTLIEALSAGCYVVATGVGGVADVVDSDRLGLLAPSGDDKTLADVMVRSLRAKQTIGVEDRKRMGSRYGIRRLVNDLDNLYSTLLQMKGLQRCRDKNPIWQGAGINE
jgi:glycosyltransferase involved in cell wall biosynthesis